LATARGSIFLKDMVILSDDFQNFLAGLGA
jgi:hypothetical protein